MHSLRENNAPSLAVPSAWSPTPKSSGKGRSPPVDIGCSSENQEVQIFKAIAWPIVALISGVLMFKHMFPDFR